MDSSFVKVEGGYPDDVARAMEARKFIGKAVGSLGMEADNLDPMTSGLVSGAMVMPIGSMAVDSSHHRNQWVN